MAGCSPTPSGGRQPCLRRLPPGHLAVTLLAVLSSAALARTVLAHRTDPTALRLLSFAAGLLVGAVVHLAVVDIAPVRAALDVRERADCDLSVSASTDGVALRSDHVVLRAALLKVGGNAVEHSDQPRPSAPIAVVASGERVRFAVRDDGPGIPDRERAVLLEDEKTPLEHGSGVGLWLVSWAVKRLCGDLAIDSDDTGSEVVLDIPREVSDAPA